MKRPARVQEGLKKTDIGWPFAFEHKSSQHEATSQSGNKSQSFFFFIYLRLGRDRTQNPVLYNLYSDVEHRRQNCFHVYRIHHHITLPTPQWRQICQDCSKTQYGSSLGTAILCKRQCLRHSFGDTLISSDMTSLLDSYHHRCSPPPICSSALVNMFHRRFSPAP